MILRTMAEKWKFNPIQNLTNQGYISSIPPSGEGMSRQKYISRSFWIKINVLYFLSQTFTPNKYIWLSKVPSVIGMLPGSWINDLFNVLTLHLGVRILFKGISDFLRKSKFFDGCVNSFISWLWSSIHYSRFAPSPNIYWGDKTQMQRSMHWNNKGA